jgi:DNA-binding MarR family transcriptional regulator
MGDLVKCHPIRDSRPNRLNPTDRNAAIPTLCFTDKQGQYLAFIHAYACIFGRPPAEADMQRHFRVTPPSVHQMVLTLERRGLIRRQAGIARSIELLISPDALPPLERQPVKSSAQRH